MQTLGPSFVNLPLPQISYYHIEIYTLYNTFPLCIFCTLMPQITWRVHTPPPGSLLCILGWCLREVWQNYMVCLWVMCTCAMGVMVSFVVPLIASESALPFPLNHAWALAFWLKLLGVKTIICVELWMLLVVRWVLCLEDGHLTWLLIRWML